MRHILILGGTVEARELAARLAGQHDVTVTLSLAGRTSRPAGQSAPVRVGGFGGVDELASYLASSRINLLVDATHPYAARISAHAAAAARQAAVPLLAIRRPAWTATATDRWTIVGTVADAIRALGQAPRRVFLTIGRTEVGAFAAAPQHHYLVRSVDPVEPPIAVPRAEYLVARGPYTTGDERVLLAQHRIEVLVAKNSGGAATYGKIVAARELEIEVVMLQRPVLPYAPAVETVEAAVSWLNHVLSACNDRGV
jgi:precorrin-6A/cobalt-precorrin-6A reductase